MKLVNDFFNKVVKVIDTKYFPEVKYYRDNKNDANVHYALECYSNGCLTYNTLLKKVSKNCKDSKENIHNVLKEFIEDYEGFIPTL